MQQLLGTAIDKFDPGGRFSITDARRCQFKIIAIRIA